ncbi:MAG: 1-deoxy-D-xylulose-5-phosphate synthase N-terminal domain-containing protein, partial [Acetanaerobacterium sp.]
GDQGKVIAVVGDGAFTNGLSFEGMNNNAGRSADNLIVILNDNAMSISKNVGALAKHLARIRSKPSYFDVKDATTRFLDCLPLIGKPVKRLITKAKTALKESLYHSNYFEAFGFTYLGPVDGHDVASIKHVLARAKSLSEPVFIHIDTVKGKGFTSAEENPGAYHGVSGIDLNGKHGATQPCEDTFSVCAGRYLVSLGDEDERICAVTAAMKYATGLNFFYKKYPERFFDVGIAEGHGVTFSAGLAAGGMLPVFAVYSTFLQRAYDEVLHDAAIENTHIVLAVDRAGLVGNDGETHQGLFDVAFLSSIPGVTIFSPFSYDELTLTLHEAIYHTDGVVAVRYPKGKERAQQGEYLPQLEYSHRKDERGQAKTVVVTYGREYAEVLAASRLTDVVFDIIKLTKVHPIPADSVDLAMHYERVLFVEEGIKNGSAAEHFHTQLAQRGFCGRFAVRAVDDQFVAQASVSAQLKALQLDGESIAKFIKQESMR